MQGALISELFTQNWGIQGDATSQGTRVGALKCQGFEVFGVLQHHGLATRLVIHINIDQFNLIALPQHHRFEAKPFSNIQALGTIRILGWLHHIERCFTIDFDVATQLRSLNRGCGASQNGQPYSTKAVWPSCPAFQRQTSGSKCTLPLVLLKVIPPS